jgi:hypothetical protein
MHAKLAIRSESSEHKVKMAIVIVLFQNVMLRERAWRAYD